MWENIIIYVSIGLVAAGGLFFALKSFLIPLRVSYLIRLMDQNKLGLALRTAKRMITKEPNNFEAHYLLSECYTRDQKPELAFMELKIVSQISKFSSICPEAEFRKKIAGMYAQFGQAEEALKEYLMLIRLQPNNTEYLLLAGELFEERNKPDVALAYYQKVIKMDSGNAEGHLRLGRLFFNRKQYIEAQAELEKAVSLGAGTGEAFFFLGKICKENHDYNAALNYLDKAVKDADMRMRVLVERGSSFLLLGNFDGAISDLERAVSMIEEENDTISLYARYYLGQAYEKAKNIDKAIDQWEKIYAVKAVFRDVGEKLSKYQEFRTDDLVKDYLTASNEDYIGMCRKVVYAMGLTVQDINPVRNGCQVVAIDEESSKWRNIKKLPKLILFLRVAERIDEPLIRRFIEEMKVARISRGSIITSSDFSPKAEEFVTSRPVELVNKERLQILLNEAKKIPD
ncbi:MAG: tetratricopeptide repeat protein [Spirochaetales bacterium]|nr:tetratricopeptide repeat protein [Spirochaetales bacterium]